jgi:two-component system sensor histidine kinase HydH
MDTPTRAFRFDRWWGLAAGIAFAIGDTLFAHWAGFRFQINGRDATFLTGCYFGSSFAMLGFGLGWLVEARRHERAQAATIRAQVGEIAATRQRLAQQEKLAALGELATAIAHEVRNPLAVIRSAAQGLAETERPDGAAIRHATDFVIAEIDRLTSVVNALLAFARPPKLAAGIVAVDDLFDRALLLARDDLDAKGIRVARGETGRVPALAADPDLLCQVLLGLLANAVEAVPAGGEVGLAARAADARTVEIDVTDSGPGIRPDVRERVFEPFFTTRPRGTGLGLAVARQIIEAHGGTIAAGERAGGGARFTLRLPAGRGATKAA